MNDLEKLERLLKTKLLPEVESFLSRLDMVEHSGCQREEDEAVYADSADLADTFKELLSDIESGLMAEAEAHEILRELKKYGA